MIWILSICVWALVMLCVILVGRVHCLTNDLAWWREEAMSLSKKESEWRRVSLELQQKLEMLMQERPETLAGYIAKMKRSICKMDDKCPLKDKV